MLRNGDRFGLNRNTPTQSAFFRRCSAFQHTRSNDTRPTIQTNKKNREHEDRAGRVFLVQASFDGAINGEEEVAVALL
ncbi:hypothetical protein TERTU_0677 [Teredinibacter turnerae T7901]|uniref:Uncharacterized protein n=1 Tax=Teredinibacter turnerae (strain ATCC 39867 / T7901) TaxID=377629 RepID=C5BNU6_TERTT|nr:hypothetical protein TERTU_0677 [Teredinibacter turnerae T7901]